jgi:hypothetical protein
MAIQHLKNILLTAAFLVGVASCGGTQLAGGGIGGTGISQGPITGFGSIFVNGVEFNTVNATIIKDGATVTQNDLEVGMVVTVDGDIASSTSGTATTVTYAKELEGPITAKATNTLTVLGQTVIVDDLTKIVVAGITSPTIDNLSLNDTVEISGTLTANGIRATYIEVKSPTADVELKGTIAAKTATTLTIGGQLVDISAVTPSFTPAIGDYVEVKGSLVGSTLAATSLELKSRTLGSGSKDKAELQGFVTGVSSVTDFVLDAQPVQTDAQTNFNGGIATDIKTGVKLEVKGALVNGVLIATIVNFKDDLELEGNIATIDTVNDILTLDSYPGIDISYNSVLTEAEGGADLNTLAIGNHVKIRGRTVNGSTCSNNSCMLATQLQLESSNPGAGLTALLQGPVEVVADPLITILGVTVDTTAIQTFSGDGVSNRTSFFAKLKVGSLVEVHGTRDTLGNVSWESIDLDD